MRPRLTPGNGYKILVMGRIAVQVHQRGVYPSQRWLSNVTHET